MPIILLVGWASITIAPAYLFGVEFTEWARRFVPLATLALFTLLAGATFRSESRIHAGAYFVMFVCFGGVSLSLLNAGSILFEFVQSPQRVRDYTGGYFSPALFTLSLGLLLGKQNRTQSYVSVLGLIIGCLGVIMSFTRTYWVSTTVSAVVVIFFWMALSEEHDYNISNILLIALCLALSLIPLLSYTDTIILQRALSIANPLQSLSFRDRLFELRGLLTTAFSNPVRLIIGHGFGTEFTFFSVNPFSWGKIGYVSISYSHNYYAYLLWTTGIVGVYLFIKSVFNALLSLIRSMGKTKASNSLGVKLAFIGMITNVSIASLTGPMLPKLRWAALFGFILGLSLNLSNNKTFDKNV